MIQCDPCAAAAGVRGGKSKGDTHTHTHTHKVGGQSLARARQKAPRAIGGAKAATTPLEFLCRAHRRAGGAPLGAREVAQRGSVLTAESLGSFRASLRSLLTSALEVGKKPGKGGGRGRKGAGAACEGQGGQWAR